MALQKLNAQVLEGGLALDNNGNMTLTGNLYATDVGDDDDPIEDFYVSNDSIWIGDEHKLQVSSTGKMKFRKRKVTTVPAVIVAAGGDEAGAKTHSGKSSLSQLKKKHWRLYARSLGGSLANAKNKDIFRDNKADYQEESDASAWQVNDVGETYATVNVGIGNTNPASSLHITGTDSLVLPAGTVAQRGTATQGGFRFNTETPGFEGYDGTEWGAIGGGSASELSTATTLKLKGSYAETMLFSDAFTLEGDLILTDNLFLAKLGEDGNDITLTDDGTSRTITGQGTLVPGAMFDNTFAISTAVQPNITQIGTTASIKVPTGTTAQRGTALAGGIRYNTTLASFEGYSGSAWGSLGGLIDVDQDTYITAEATADVDTLDFWTAGTQRMIINSSGNIGIGTPTPTGGKLHVASGDINIDANQWIRIGGQYALSGDGSGNTFLDNGGGYLSFRTVGTQRMQILNDGAVAIGKAATSFNSTGVSLECIDGLSISSTTTNPNIYLDNQTTNGKKWTFQAESGDGALTCKNVTDNNTAFQINTSGQFLGLNVSGTVTATGGTSSNWNTAYGWGNHASAGYATSGSAWTTTGNDIYYTTGNVGIGLTSGISEKLYVSGNISATGDVTSSASDERLKENIEIIENAVDKIKTIDGIKFDWVSNIEEIGLKPKNKTEVGLIAQQLEKVLPEAVCPAPFDTPGTGISLSGEHYLTIRYEKVVPLLIEAIKEQQQQIDELKEKLNGI